MVRALLLFGATLLAASISYAQNSPPTDQTEQVRLLLERIQQLERRVTDLEAKQAPASATAVSAANESPVPSRSSQQQTPPAATQSHEHEVREQAATDQKGTTSGFNLGQLDLHLASALSRKVTYFGELTFNAHPTDYTVEVERNIIRYDYNDYFKISFGRYHTPIGNWNTAFHHGAWLQTTITRPDFVRFGGTFIPVHFVGLLAEGNIPSGGAGLSYNVGVGNGRGNVISRPGDAGDNNNNRAWVANLYSRPVRLYGLQMGISVYRDKITLPNTLPNGNNFREWISAAHLVWTKESPEFLAEFANVNHRNILTNFVTNSQAFYAQVGYRLPWFEKTLKPYYRFEHTHTSLSEQVFTNQELVGSIIGLRYDITNYAAFKAEYRNSKRLPTDPRVNGVFFQTAFTF